jgi:type VI protein secretion system component Hcp
VPMSRKPSLRAPRAMPVKAALAAGCAAIASTLLALPATAAVSSATPDKLIRPSFSFPGMPSDTATSLPTTITVTTISQPTGNGGAHAKKSTSAKATQANYDGYVSTFSPAPVVSTPAAVTSTAACVANTQAVTGSGGDLDLPGITGASKDAGHAGALPVTALSPAEMLPPNIDSADLSQLVLTRTADASSANLSMIASSGYRFPCVHIEMGPGQGYASVEYALVNAGLVADDRAGSTETMTWTYDSILWSYTLNGSATVHHGSGRINARPDKVNGSLADDSKAIALGTIGLTAVVALGLIGLYVAGLRRNRARYRARYYRRAAIREARANLVDDARAEAESAAATVAAEPADVEVEPQPEPLVAVEAVAEPEAEPEPELETVSEPEPEPEPEPIAEPEAEAEAEAPQATEPEPEAEAEPKSESVPEPEAVSEPEPDSEPEAETESESEPEPEAKSEAAPESEPEPESSSESESEQVPQRTSAT